VPLRIGDAALAETPAHLVALDNRLIDCTVTHEGGSLWIEVTTGEIAPGMSGSPILNHIGAAIGIVSQSSGSLGRHTKGMSPRLITNFPGWLLLELGASDLLTAARRELRAFHRRQIADVQRRIAGMR
jgi:hypothetical protein